MKLDTYKLDGSKDSSVNADKTVFGIKANQNVVHQAINAELTNLRQGTHSSKNRANVRGGGKKPFKQKSSGSSPEVLKAGWFISNFQKTTSNAPFQDT